MVVGRRRPGPTGRTAPHLGPEETAWREQLFLSSSELVTLPFGPLQLGEGEVEFFLSLCGVRGHRLALGTVAFRRGGCPAASDPHPLFGFLAGSSSAS